MSKKYKVYVQVWNNTSDTVAITLWYKNKGVPQSQTWDVVQPSRATYPPLEIEFDGSNSSDDAWSVKLALLNGGTYQSGGSDNWTNCPLSSSYDGETFTFTVDTETFDIALPKGTTSSMRLVSNSEATQIDNVFVLMLENHSFDNIFAFSGIEGIEAATTANTNTYNGTTYAVSKDAPQGMPTDPGHEFEDVLVQLCGPPPNGEPVSSWRVPWTPYNQPINNSGFAYNYATSTTEKPTGGPALPSSGEIGDVMACFNTQAQLPIIYTLATEFALCYRWFSSLPGPTWPNRFFVHGAGSNGWADSPGKAALITWNVFGFRYPNGSVYSRLNDKNLGWRIYHDKSGALSGSIPQVVVLADVGESDLHSFKHFAKDVLNPYPYPYTFIEPNYGDVILGTYTDGSSQHPMDTMVKGEALIKATYEAIRNSPLWSRSLLIITYDEHGGFYDSMIPGPAPQPSTSASHGVVAQSRNESGFLFDQYGVRVPAVIVSPQIAKGVVDGTLYDHASVSATLNAIFETGTLTRRDAQANELTALLNVFPPRTDCPTKLPKVSRLTVKNDAAVLDEAALAAQPLPERGNEIGLLMLLGKRDVALSGGDEAAAAAVRTRMEAIETRGDLAAYAAEVEAKRLMTYPPRDGDADDEDWITADFWTDEST